jgi:glycosyltransferase involved in cell wall biosynthesis
MSRKTVCLNMIVKNESRVIRRCLSSLKHLIDYWVIVDTGSSDGTQQVIKESLKEVPGELHERPWVDFGHNRNEALDLARDKADYLLFIDADDRLVFSSDFTLPDLDKDCYCALQKESKKTNVNTGNYLILLIKGSVNFRWIGVLHETIESPEVLSCEVLSEVSIEYFRQGCRSQDPEIAIKDVQVLEKAVQEDPSNGRNVFFLAQSYVNVDNYPSALEWYKKRVDMGEERPEVFYSLYVIGVLQKLLNMPSEVFVKSLHQAYRYNPSRIEPLYAMVAHYINVGDYLMGYTVAKEAILLPFPEDVRELFVNIWIYEWGALLQFYLCAQSIGKYEEAIEALKKLLLCSTLPPDQRSLLRRDLFQIELAAQQAKQVALSKAQ